MVMTDPLADMLTRIRNAYKAGHETVTLPSSKLKEKVAKILRDEGYVDAYKSEQDGKQGVLSIHLRYDADHRPMVKGIQRVSKPGLRQYAKSNEIPAVLDGLGIMIVSTSHGVMTDRQAREQNVGGELLCRVW
ncbi:MAG: 30S ribosomal protein S8 [Deltaproteobacteria bacterium]|nr:30S ribosomal protein S8 [Deltaproteobacteria bacterium]MCB9479010.1 30S ribosomal protein S8 [Deltaproteobacteria bacterium]MCB9487782.1 30S ribosomal protein S8 [Deltaproteobacteria bacterium]